MLEISGGSCLKGTARFARWEPLQVLRSTFLDGLLDDLLDGEGRGLSSSYTRVGDSAEETEIVLKHNRFLCVWSGGSRLPTLDQLLHGEDRYGI